MAYGMQAWQEPELEFPALMDGADVDELFKPEEEEKVPRFQPINVIRKYSLPLAEQLQQLWGYPGFCKFVESITDPRRLKGVVLPADLLGALLALSVYHAENMGQLDDISVRVPDPTAAAATKRRAAC